ncbi:secretory lipase family protein [Metarhizium robertsii]|uniref:Lipase 2 n=2 Tax=Metarhizium robertsii TaxID=568076 RepID=E9F3J3_METRA|nr:lipase 2 [Metarhizium robertsii ARSEF 23]EFY97730.1 lipase 2 [Metarhizium robertsii ARSEF 23]EXV05243.1 secretory lipase family protein [Metarhizium robertsii]
MGMSLRVFLTAVLATLANAIPTPLSQRSGPMLPSKDPFYAVPDNISRVEPGTILRRRKPLSPIAAFGIAPLNLNSSYQLLYRTTDSFGNATATVLTVLIPHKADRSKLLSYQVAEDAASIDCAPSYALQLHSAAGPLLGTLLTQGELILVQGALDEGWVVVIPDFQGPNAAFLANRRAGYATLDGIRAALNSSPFTGIRGNSTITMWGYSGGSLATNHAAELQPEYAPELQIAGAAVGGTVPNITNALTSINKGLFAGLIPTGILGLSAEYPDVAQLVQDHLKLEKSEAFLKAGTRCLLANAAAYLLKDIIDMFDDRNFMYQNKIVVQVLNENALGKKTPKIPLYWYKSVFDQVSPIADSDAVVKKYCDGGASVEYVRDIASEHGSYAVMGAPKALYWLKNIMKGGKPKSGCSRKTLLSSLLDIRTWGIAIKLGVNALLNLFHKPVGPPVFG